MASFQKHTAKNGAVSWRAQIFVNGIHDSKSGFTTKPDAKLWAAQREIEILANANKPTDNLIPVSPKIILPVQVTIRSKTLGEVFDRYVAEVSPTKAGYRWEKIRLYKLSASPFAKTSLLELGPEHIVRWRDDRLNEVSSATVRREMTLISTALQTAKQEWRWIAINPCREVRKPADSKHRTQRISAEELQRLLGALEYVEGAASKYVTGGGYGASDSSTNGYA